MKDIILETNAWDIEINEAYFKDRSSDFKCVDIKTVEIVFPENVYQQVEILNKFVQNGYYVYMQLYSFYQDNIGRLKTPSWYYGRLILSKQLGSFVIEFQYDERLLDNQYREFISSLFWTSKVFVSKMNPQRMQEYYYEFSEEKLKEYLDNIICAIDVDNDGSYMKFFYGENVKINNKNVREFILQGVQNYKILDEEKKNE